MGLRKTDFMIEKLLFTKEVFLASAVTLGLILLNMVTKQRRSVWFYVIYFAAMYLMFLGFSLYGDEEGGTTFISSQECITDKYFQCVRNNSVTENEEGIIFLESSFSVFDLESFIQFAANGVPSRDELVQKMMYHKMQHDISLKNARDVILRFNKWTKEWESLYLSAIAAVSTYYGT
jgi:hypothetical protein